MMQYYANIFSSEDFQWKKNLLKILQFFHISQKWLEIVTLLTFCASSFKFQVLSKVFLCGNI